MKGAPGVGRSGEKGNVGLPGPPGSTGLPGRKGEIGRPGMFTNGIFLIFHCRLIVPVD